MFEQTVNTIKKVNQKYVTMLLHACRDEIKSDCTLSLMTEALTVSMSDESLFQIIWLKKEMRNNVDNGK